MHTGYFGSITIKQGQNADTALADAAALLGTTGEEHELDLTAYDGLDGFMAMFTITDEQLATLEEEGVLELENEKVAIQINLD